MKPSVVYPISIPPTRICSRSVMLGSAEKKTRLINHEDGQTDGRNHTFNVLTLDKPVCTTRELF